MSDKKWKEIKVIPFQTRDEMIETIKQNFPSGDCKIVGFTVTGRLEHSTKRSQFGNTRLLPSDPENYELRRLDDIEFDLREAAQARRYSIVIPSWKQLGIK